MPIAARPRVILHDPTYYCIFLVFWTAMAAIAVKLHFADGYTFNIVGGLFAFGLSMVFGLPLFLSCWLSTRYKGSWTQYGHFDVFIIENPKALWKDLTRFLRRFGISSLRPARRRRAREKHLQNIKMQTLISLKSSQIGIDFEKRKVDNLNGTSV
jgi:hypothetical protein